MLVSLAAIWTSDEEAERSTRLDTRLAIVGTEQTNNRYTTLSPNPGTMDCRSHPLASEPGEEVGRPGRTGQDQEAGWAHSPHKIGAQLDSALFANGTGSTSSGWLSGRA